MDLVDLAIQTGCRRKELLELEWDRIDWKNNEIILEAKHTKSAKARKVPLNPSARSVLIRRAGVRSEHCPNTPWVFFHLQRWRNTEVGNRIKSMNTAMRSACKRGGPKGVTFHTLRHTCASWLGQMQGVEALTIRESTCSAKSTIRFGTLAFGCFARTFVASCMSLDSSRNLSRRVDLSVSSTETHRCGIRKCMSPVSDRFQLTTIWIKR